MSGKPAARLGDPTACPEKGHGNNPISAGSPDVLFDGLPAARQGDPTACGSMLADKLIGNVLINGRPAAVLGSLGSHGNAVVGGSGTVIIGTAPAAARLTSPATLAAHTPQALSPGGDTTARTWQEKPGDPAPLALEEEEEEEELEEPVRLGIILRIGLFFDGTGNNRANSESVAGCFARDVNLQEEAEGIRAFCAAHGYDGKGSAPDNSYGNDLSNVARLYELYKDESDKQLEQTAKTANLRIYVDGIGTYSGGEDSLYSQGLGTGATGVVARVMQSPAQILERIRRLKSLNPGLLVTEIEFDIFGFSRGAAAARHFANEVLKGAQGILPTALPTGTPILADGFAWRAGQDVRINFIGLFDSVAAISAPLKGDLGGHNGNNPGINLKLSAAMANRIVQLVARDEQRHNFSLNSAGAADIPLPGVHSDIGGGYLPRATEKLLLSKPRSSRVSRDSAPERSVAYRQTLAELDTLRTQWPLDGTQLRIRTWQVDLPFDRKRDMYPEKRVYAAISSEREVCGELALVYLRIMRELAVRHGVPMRPIQDRDPRLALPAELQPIAYKLQAYALGERPDPGLSDSEEALLRRRYIHRSAHWNAAKGLDSSGLEVLFINRPTANGQRVVHPNE
ncbi:PAAR motif protein [compost metagenome]